ncbi:hypothetical protein J4G43_049435 [Bradyrhizobium barranii subsp. barranii]|uniref:Uncharacterized protein n=1 Tax=Bradyrhizobium barranii subsp. barranii TaxID=2823807 RepID=A0A939MF94_9BRAD|nr:hypothetical protein [Bradyrhizobium barranii]UEM12347.1 hypothetical protein J4G43_049435 [Bradyrhizobium barranii subsp. barranii]
MLEHHDLLLASHSDADKKPRIPVAADPSNPISWYARSRAQIAGLLITGLGVPLLFMGQEFLKDKYWDDSTGAGKLQIWWDGPSTDRAVSDYLRFTREPIALRRELDTVWRGLIDVYWDSTRVLAIVGSRTPARTLSLSHP